MNAVLSKMLVIFLASFIAGFGGCAGAFVGFRAIGFVKPSKSAIDNQIYKYMKEKQIDEIGENDENL